MENQTFQPPSAPYRDPQWWTERHASAWDRVKDAFRRDWEQTKADLAFDGHDLNQGAGDTVRQALGSGPIPMPGEKTPTDPKRAAREATREREKLIDANARAEKAAIEANAAVSADLAKLNEKVADARADAAKAEEKARDKIEEARRSAAEKSANQAHTTAEKIADAQRSASEDIEKRRDKAAEAAGKRDEVAARWRQAEQEGRYGYALRMQRPNEPWTEAFEGSVRGEWEALKTGRSWQESRQGIRLGWDRAGLAS